MANNTFPNTKKLSDAEERGLSTLKENAELEPNKYYIPAIKAGEENYIVPVTDFGKGGGGSDVLRIFDTIAKNKFGLQYLAMSQGDEVLAIVNGQDVRVGFRKDNILESYQRVPGFSGGVKSNPLDMSKISGIDWITWQSAAAMSSNGTDYYMVDGDDTEYFDVYNPYMELTLDTSTMTIGKVYTIHISAIRNRHDTEVYNEPFYETKSNTHGTITTTTTKTSTKESLMMFGSTGGGASSVVTGWFSVKPEIDDMPIATNTTGTVTLCKASVYYNNAGIPRPEGVDVGDLVCTVSYGGSSTYFVFHGTAGVEPNSPNSPETLDNITFNSRSDGSICFSFDYRESLAYATVYRYNVVMRRSTIESINVSTDAGIPVIDWKKWVVHGGASKKATKPVDDIGPRILSPNNGPKFYWPYLLASGSTDAVTTVIPRFYLTNTVKPSEQSLYASDYIPDIPNYGAIVYMCRIDDEHVLILGY